jgi:hypothetical protein
MKSEKEKLAAKSVDQLKAAAKRLGGKLVNPDGKAKTKQQLINTIVMKNRLAGKSMGGNVVNTPKNGTPKIKLDALKTKAKKIGYKYRMDNKLLKISGNPDLMALIKNLTPAQANPILRSYTSGYFEAALELGRIAVANYLKNKA